VQNIEQEIKAVIRDVPDFPKPGIMFKDITPFLAKPKLCSLAVDYTCQFYKTHSIDAVAGLESRGFLLGMMIAQKLNVPFIPIRKKGKLPYKTISQSYLLEYGSAEIEIHEDAIEAGSNVLIHDDLLATGGTAVAAAQLIKKCGCNVTGFSFIIELEFLNGKQHLEKYSNQILSLVTY
jgi:adenine phosphoribosyltransferase